MLDETLIPRKMHYIKVRSTAQAVKVIRDMKTRAFGQFLVVANTFLLELKRLEKKSNRNKSPEKIWDDLKQVADQLNQSRPTFPFSEVTAMFLSWVQEARQENLDIRRILMRKISGYLQGIRQRRLRRVLQIADRIKDGDSVLTHCNVSGELAMAAYICHQQKKEVHFFATETRPYLQGTRLTYWELKRLGAQVTLIPDNTVGSLMADGLVNKVIVGSDRNCANGDFANKIGTYQIAVLAREFEVPFYVLTQPSEKIKKGEDIPIEIRKEEELLSFEGKRIFPEKVKGVYPAFDVIPHELVTQEISINVG